MSQNPHTTCSLCLPARATRSIHHHNPCSSLSLTLFCGNYLIVGVHRFVDYPTGGNLQMSRILLKVFKMELLVGVTGNTVPDLQTSDRAKHVPMLASTRSVVVVRCRFHRPQQGISLHFHCLCVSQCVLQLITGHLSL